jgi:DNA polymerase III alpha subunit (gram-positive type)
MDFATTITNEVIASKKYESFITEGQIFKIEEKSFKEGSTFFIISISNYEDAFVLRAFEDSPKNDNKYRQRTDLPLAYLKTFKVGN